VEANALDMIGSFRRPVSAEAYSGRRATLLRRGCGGLDGWRCRIRRCTLRPGI